MISSNGFNFVGFDPSDPKYKNDVDTFLNTFSLLGLDDIYVHDFSIDVYWLDVRSVVKNNGAYFKNLSKLAYYKALSDDKAHGIYAQTNASQLISDLTYSSSGYTFAKFMNEVRNLVKKLSYLKNKVEKENQEKGKKVRYDYFTLVKYYDGD